MKIISKISEMRAFCQNARAKGLSIAFVPTMGYLHEGHLSLLREGRQRADLLILSIFINPTQFAPNEDLERYPQDLKRDTELAKVAGVDVIFHPRPESIYPNDFSTYVDVEGSLTSALEGLTRPSHFRGVATVVTKLFNIVQPHMALFGQKDFQQLAVVRRMVEDLNFEIDIIGMPIVREADGLAMSSRNVYLSIEERRQSLAIYDALCTVSKSVQNGIKSASALVHAARERLNRETSLEIDYVKVCDAETLCEVDDIDTNTVMLVAVKIGKTRLIDNHILSREVQCP